MASFDVTSLFTNIPVGETIEIISNQIFANRMVFKSFDCSQFIKLLSLAVRNCHFTFNNRIYQQIDGVAMERFVCVYVGVFGLHTMCHSIDTYIYKQHVI